MGNPGWDPYKWHGRADVSRRVLDRGDVHGSAGVQEGGHAG